MEIRRDFYLDKLIKRKNNGLIKVISGISRCGKSYLLNNLFYHHLNNCSLLSEINPIGAFPPLGFFVILGEVTFS